MISMLRLAMVSTIASTLLATTLFSMGCAQQNSIDSTELRGQSSGITGTLPAAPTAFTVTDSAGQPIAGATVMIGKRPGVPFSNNVLTTDALGTITVPAEWVDSQPITVDAKNFVRTTWMSQMPGFVTLQVRNKPAGQKLELKGKATGFKNLVEDGWADVGLVFPALSRGQLANLQISDLVSPESDTISALGQSFDIPSNVSIPKQTERYIFSITLDKPVFRTYLGESKTWKMVATHAKFPFESVIDELRNGKSFYDVLNFFEFQSASVKDVSLTNPSTSQDIPITDMLYVPSIDVAAPKFSSKYSMLAVSVVNTNGLLFPTDVKLLSSNETRRLVAPKASSGFVLGALRDSRGALSGTVADGLSAVIAPSTQTTRFEFLDVPNTPKFSGGVLKAFPPSATVATVTQAATYAILSKVDARTTGKTTIDAKSPVWDVYANGWSNTLELPDMPTLAKGSYRWEVMFGGAPNGTTVQLGPNLVEGLSHVAKSAVDL